jgi:hypothetical protein
MKSASSPCPIGRLRQDDQRYGMVEAISHLVHRDYAEIGDLALCDGSGATREGFLAGGKGSKTGLETGEQDHK